MARSEYSLRLVFSSISTNRRSCHIDLTNRSVDGDSHNSSDSTKSWDSTSPALKKSNYHSNQEEVIEIDIQRLEENEDTLARQFTVLNPVKIL